MKAKSWYSSADWRTALGFWLLGVCNNFGYVAVLTAAYDLLTEEDHSVPTNITITNITITNITTTTRQCNHLSSGVILLADIAPNLVVKLVSPFFPLWIHSRAALAVVISIAGFILVASEKSKILMVCGVILTSISSGLGESSFLMYMPFFDTNRVISAWSAGTGASGVLASLSYLGLISAGVTLSTALYMMLVVPVIMAFSFWFIIQHPKTGTEINKNVVENCDVPQNKLTFFNKLKITYKLLGIYMIPFALVYYFEYAINQGLFELMQFKNSIVSLADQVRWYNFDYQIGVLVSRSVGDILEVDFLWFLALLQGSNLLIMTTESIFGWMGHASYSFWIVVGVVFWEGLLAGTSYFNTFRRINDEMPSGQKQFSMSMTSLGAPIGIMLAGLSAIPLHQAICSLPPH